MSQMQEQITIDKTDYEALLSRIDDLEDRLAAECFLANPQPGIPSELVDRMLEGESPLAILREWRDFSQSGLSRASGVNRVQISDIEAGRKHGSVATLQKLAAALDVTIDDLV